MITNNSGEPLSAAKGCLVGIVGGAVLWVCFLALILAALSI